MRQHLLKFGSKIRSATRSNAGRFAAATTAMVAPFAAFAGGGSTPGAVIAGELAGGGADMGLIFAACAVLIGLLLLWAYSKRAAR